MTIRLVVDGRGTLLRDVVNRLVATSGGAIELAVHFGDRDADFHAACLSRAEVRYGKKGHLVQRHQSIGAQMPLLASAEYQLLLEQGVEQLHRNSANYRYRAHNLTHLQDYLDYYHILADGFAQEIEATGATHALFLNVPHLGYDAVLYHVAMALQLKILVVSQTFFPDSFFSMERVEDFGHVNPDGPTAAPLAIEKGSAPDLFYMEDHWQQPGPRGKLGLKAVVSLVKHLALRSPGKLFNPSYVLGNLRRMRAIYGGLPDWRNPFSKFFHPNEMAYFEHLAGYESQPVDLNAPFVYFPLHNQPEMSTQSLGGVFRDQLLAVEAIASILPDGWRIFVKENPRQGAYSRGPMFFHRLSRIKGVQFVPSETSTHELSTRAKITATVSGTAGWEALRKGKPVVVFGGGWWRDFPGVFPWSPKLDLAAIAETTFPHDALEQSFGTLQARCHAGVIEGIFQERTKDYDHDQNIQTVALTVQGLLTGTVPVTFRQTGKGGA